MKLCPLAVESGEYNSAKGMRCDVSLPQPGLLIQFFLCSLRHCKDNKQEDPSSHPFSCRADSHMRLPLLCPVGYRGNWTSSDRSLNPKQKPLFRKNKKKNLSPILILFWKQFLSLLICLHRWIPKVLSKNSAKTLPRMNYVSLPSRGFTDFTHWMFIHVIHSFAQRIYTLGNFDMLPREAKAQRWKKQSFVWKI